MFGKRNKPSQSQQDDFAPADFSEDFGDTFEAADQDQHDDPAAWGEPQETATAQTQTSHSQKKSSSGSGKMMPVLAVAGLGVAAAGYFFLLPQSNTAQPVVAEVAETQENAPLLSLPATEAPATSQLAAAPALTPTGTPEAATPSLPETAPVSAAQATDGLAAAPVVSDVTTPQVASASAPVDMATPPSADETPLASVSEPAMPLETAPAAVTQAVSPVSDASPVVASSVPLATTSAPAAPVTMPQSPVTQTAAAPVSPQSSAPAPAMVSGQAKPLVDASADAAALSARLTVLERQIDDLTKAVDKIAAAAPTETVARLSKTVDALSKQVVALKAAPVKTSIIASSRPLVAPTAEVASDPVPSATPVMSASSAAPVVSQPATRVEPQTQAASKPVAWVLRAAQSGTAWVSPSKDGNLQRVAVGETLAGVGRIQSIEIKDGAWEITGTKGKIRQ